MGRTLSTAAGVPVAHDLRWARSPRERVVGLLGRTEMSPGEALVISPGGQVHTFGMRFPIDVLFCDDRWRVKHIVRGLRPWRVTRWVRGTTYVIELPAGAIPGSVTVGDRLRLD